MSRTPRIRRPEDERLRLGPTFAYGLQHVLTMYGGIIAVPLIIGNAAGLAPGEIGLLIASCLFIGGLATILQSWGVPFFGSQLPLVQGVSFSGVATMTAILAAGEGLPGVFGAVIAASVAGLIVAPFFAMIVRFFPPVVTGTVITTIGLTLMPVAAQWAMGGTSPEDPMWGSVQNIGLAMGTLVLVLVLSKVASPTVSRLAILISIVVGTTFAGIFGWADFSNVADGGIVALPQPFAFGLPTFGIASIISMFIVIIVTMTETTADIIAVGEIVGTKVDSKRIADGLRADMISSAVAPIFNSFTQSAFAQNVGLVAITGVKSRFVVSAGGVILVVLGLLPIVGGLVAAVPPPVLGGAGIVLFGSVAAAGIRTLAKVDYEGNMNMVIVAVSLGFGIIPVVLPEFYDAFPSWVGIILHSGISSAALMAVVLNLLFNHIGGKSSERSAFIPGTGRVIREEDLARLLADEALFDGATIKDGKVLDADGEEVPIVTASQEVVVTDAIKTGKIRTRDDLRRVLAKTKP